MLKAFWFGTAAALLAGPGLAQTSPQAAQPAAVDEVVVTASRIARDGFQQPTPVTVLGEAEIRREAPVSLAAYVNTMPAFGTPVSSRAPVSGIGGGTAGAAFLNLRNLGVTRTLVMLDNRRVANAALGGGVDVNLLPTSLVKRVEVVTGGASAAWGSDAVSGVVNFVLDHDFEGVRINTEYGLSTHGDDENGKIELTLGRPFAGGRGHVVASAAYFNSPGIARTGDRDWYVGYRLVNNPAAGGAGQPRLLTRSDVGVALGTIGGVITSGPLRGTQFVGPSGTPAPFNFGNPSGNVAFGGDNEDPIGEAFNIANRQEYANAFVHVRYDLTDNVTAYAEFTYGNATGENDTVGYSRLGNLTLTTDNAYLDPTVRARLTALGQTNFSFGTLNLNLGFPGSLNERTLMRGVVGLDGKFGEGWSWGAYYQRGEVKVDTVLPRNPLVPRYNLAVDAVRDPRTGTIVCRSTLTDANNGCVPLNVFGVGVASPAAIDYVIGTKAWQRIDTSQDVVSASLQGPAFTLPAGDVSVAAGVEFRRETAKATQDPNSQARLFFAGNFQPFSGEIEVKEGFVETVVPLFKDAGPIKLLEVNAAARLTDYSTSGSVVTWKLGANANVFEDLRIRGTVSRDIRAPTLAELFTRGQSGTQNITDPLNGRVNQTLVNTRGNPDLDPEKADTITAGIIYSPSWAPGLRASLDYYNISIKDAIFQVAGVVVVNRCAAGQTDFCSQLVRNAAGVLTQVDVFAKNVSEEALSGWDLELAYRRELGPGALNLRLLGTYLDELSLTEGGVKTDSAGAVGYDTGVAPGLPKLRANLTASYDQDDWSLTARIRYVGHAKLNNKWTRADVDDNSVPAIGYLDLRGNYRLQNRFGVPAEVTLAVDNLFDTDPPRVAEAQGGSAGQGRPGVRLDLHDAIGRTLRFGVRAQF